MGWLDRLLGRPESARQDVAERLTTYGPFRTTTETVELGDRETVRRWLRELDRSPDRPGRRGGNRAGAAAR
ncbi:hypothetical protein Nm8I071_43520 [Nonomuraea sp. TT08I-71]|nr:hypothetical protein Nm8I071_43520 [Nonomuraea sp. TT08I-71]